MVQLGLSDDWAANILTQVGNYSESFEKHIGPNTPINIQRGLNALYKMVVFFTHLHSDKINWVWAFAHTLNQPHQCRPIFLGG